MEEQNDLKDARTRYEAQRLLEFMDELEEAAVSQLAFVLPGLTQTFSDVRGTCHVPGILESRTRDPQYNLEDYEATRR